MATPDRTTGSSGVEEGADLTEQQSGVSQEEQWHLARDARGLQEAGRLRSMV